MAPTKPALTPEFLAARHRRQVRLQIWLPIGITLLLVLAVAALAILGTVNQSSEVNRWGNISAILLIIPNLLTSLITIAILILSVRGLAILYRKVPGWMQSLLAILKKIQAVLRNLADKSVAPVLSINSAGAGLSAIRKKFTPHKQTRSS